MNVLRLYIENVSSRHDLIACSGQNYFSYVIWERFFGRLTVTVVLHTIHLRDPPPVNDGKRRAVNRKGLSANGRPLLGSR